MKISQNKNILSIFENKLLKFIAEFQGKTCLISIILTLNPWIDFSDYLKIPSQKSHFSTFFDYFLCMTFSPKLSTIFCNLPRHLVFGICFSTIHLFPNKHIKCLIFLTHATVIILSSFHCTSNTPLIDSTFKSVSWFTTEKNLLLNITLQVG